ncbi:MAG: hypothetical protein RLZZ292_2870 [Bacteroidota bacterium]|jgi:ABC-type lipoprotein export system ATPase subunit
MIQRLIIKKLFLQEQNNYDVTFFNDLNILTGRNGSGKTTIMKILWYAISGHFDVLVNEISFESITIDTDKFRLILETNQLPTYKLSITYTDTPDGNQEIKNYILKPILEKYHKTLFFPTFRRIEGGFTIVPKIGDMVENNEIYESFNELSNRLSRSALGLDNHRFAAYVSTNDLNKLLQDQRINIATEKERLDQDRTLQIQELAKNNNGAGILQVLDETNTKMGGLDTPFGILDKLVNEQFKKRILLTDRVTIGTNLEYPVVQSQRLSSGEKQFFSLLVYCLFLKGTSVFIDEPEISLHPDWQRAFLPLLLQQNGNNQFFITTHSDMIAAPYPHHEIVIQPK